MQRGEKLRTGCSSGVKIFVTVEAYPVQLKVRKLLGKRLKALRVYHNLTQEEFSELCKFEYKFYQSIESARKTEIKFATMERIARFYHIEVWQLLAPVMPRTKLRKRR